MNLVLYRQDIFCILSVVSFYKVSRVNEMACSIRETLYSLYQFIAYFILVLHLYLQDHSEENWFQERMVVGLSEAYSVV